MTRTTTTASILLAAALLGARIDAPIAQETPPPPPKADPKKDPPKPGASGLPAIQVAGTELTLGGTATSATPGPPPPAGPLAIPVTGRDVPVPGAIVVSPGAPNGNLRIGLPTNPPAPAPPNENLRIGVPTNPAAPPATGTSGGGRDATTGMGTTGQPAAGSTPMPSEDPSAPGMQADTPSASQPCVSGDAECPCPEDEAAGVDARQLRQGVELESGRILDGARQPYAPLLRERGIEDERATQQEQMTKLAAAAQARKEARAIEIEAVANHRTPGGQVPDEVQKALRRWYAEHGLNVEGPLSYYVEGLDPVGGRRPVTVRVTFKGPHSEIQKLRFRYTQTSSGGRVEWLPHAELTLEDLAYWFDKHAEDVAYRNEQAAQQKQDAQDAKRLEAERASEAAAADRARNAVEITPDMHGRGTCGNGAGWQDRLFDSCPPEPESEAEPSPAPEAESAPEVAEDETPKPPTVEEQIEALDAEIEQRDRVIARIMNIPGKGAAEHIQKLQREIDELKAQRDGLRAGAQPTTVSQVDEAWQKDAATHIADQTARVEKQKRHAVQMSQNADAAAEAYAKAVAEVAAGQRDPSTLSALRTHMEATRLMVDGATKRLVSETLLLESLTGYVATAAEALVTTPLAQVLAGADEPERKIVVLASAAAVLQGETPIDVEVAHADLRKQLDAADAHAQAYADKRDAYLDGQEQQAVRAGEFVRSGVAVRLEERSARLEQLTREGGDAAEIDELTRRIRVDRSLVRAFEADLQTIQDQMPHVWELDPQAQAAEHDARVLRAVELMIDANHTAQKRVLNFGALNDELARLRGQGVDAGKIADVERVLTETERVYASREQATSQAVKDAFAANQRHGIGPTSAVELRTLLEQQGLDLGPTLVLTDAQRDEFLDGRRRVIEGGRGAASQETYFAADLAREFLAQTPNLLNPLHTGKASAGALYGAASHLAHAVIDLGDLGGELLAADTDTSWHVRLALGPAGWLFGTSFVADAFGTDKIDGIQKLTELVGGNDWSTIGSHLNRAAWQGIGRMQQGDAVWNNAKFGGAVAIEAIMLGLSGGSRGVATTQAVGLDLARLAAATGRMLERGAKLERVASAPTLVRAFEGAARASNRLGRGFEGLVEASRARQAASAGAARAADDIPGGTTLVDPRRARPAVRDLLGDDPWIGPVEPPFGHVYTAPDRAQLASFFESTGEITTKHIPELVRYWEGKGLEPAVVMAGRALDRGLPPQLLEMGPDQIRALLHRYLRDVSGHTDVARRDAIIERYLRSGDDTLAAVAPRPTPPRSPGAAQAVDDAIFDEATVIVHENQAMPVRRAVDDAIFDEATVIVHESQAMPVRRAVGEETATSLSLARDACETATWLGAAPVLDPPRTIGEVLRRIRNVNPGFPDAGRGVNCQDCVQAVERILRGEDPALVRAAVSGDESYNRFVLESMEAVAHIDPVLDRARDWIRVAGREQIEGLMAATPPGSYARVWGKRAGGEYGHVFNVWNDGKQVWFIDGQTGSMGTFAGQGYTELSLLLTGF